MRYYMTENKICEKCKKTIVYKIETLPCKMEDKRFESLFCPNCNYEVEKDIRLLGNEEIKIIKVQ